MPRFVAKLQAAFVVTGVTNFESARQKANNAFDLEALKSKGLDTGIFTIGIEEQEKAPRTSLVAPAIPLKRI